MTSMKINLAVLIAALLGTLSCNLDFDADSYGTLTADDLPGCSDSDGDGFGVGADCIDDQRDCDDSDDAIYPGALEVCDGIDNDCNDEVDDDGDGGVLSTECYTGADEELLPVSTACSKGQVYCDRGTYPSPVTAGDCQGQVLPADGEADHPEKCDGVDNDCDGTVDPRCECPEEGLVEPCYDGPAQTRGVGACADGQRLCYLVDSGDLEWGPCEGARTPADESCDNAEADDDCNETVDDVPGLGDECDTGELGRCQQGAIACSDEGEEICARQREPASEVCDDLDLDCDGEPRNGVANVCGGCEPLGVELGTVCGACEDGLLVCDGEDAVQCQDATPLNGCGGCRQLSDEPGSACGLCGLFQCTQEDNNVVECADPGHNVCGGCGVVQEREMLGERCGECGVLVCNDDLNGILCENAPFNACGGCAPLEGTPGEECGECSGEYICGGADSVICDGGDPNVCGGCTALEDIALGEECGACGLYACEGEEAIVCDDPGLNSCLLCEVLEQVPGAPCDVDGCGDIVCDDELGVSCDTRRCPSQPTAFRFFHGLDGANVDVALDGSFFYAFEPGVSTVYVRATPGAHTLSFYEEGRALVEGDLLFHYPFELAEGENITLAFMGVTDGDYGVDNIYRFTDDATPVEGRVRLRWIHSYYGVLGGNVRVDGVKDGETQIFFSSLGFGQTETITIDPGVYEVSVRSANGGIVYARFNRAFTFLGGNVRTMMHLGRTGGLNRAIGTEDVTTRYFP
jgi:hypothetical protein